MRLLLVLLWLVVAGCRTTPTESPIPKIVHQVWIGSDKLPVYFDLYKKSFDTYAPDFEYRLWTNKDLTPENFPLTYSYILKVVKIGKELYGENPAMWMKAPTRKMAQIADLLRYEIIFKHGGIYMDTKFEVVAPLQQALVPGKRLILANEDPCNRHCEYKFNGDPYVSNAFFAAVPGHPVLGRILAKETLDAINFKEERVNIETGPLFFRKHIRDNEGHFLNTVQIYPYHNWPTAYRKAGMDLCVGMDKKRVSRAPNLASEVTKHKFGKRTIYIASPCRAYPNSIAVLHLVLGSTWKK